MAHFLKKKTSIIKILLKNRPMHSLWSLYLDSQAGNVSSTCDYTNIFSVDGINLLRVQVQRPPANILARTQLSKNVQPVVDPDGEVFFATLQEEVAQHVVEPLGIADAFAGTEIKDFGIKGCREF